MSLRTRVHNCLHNGVVGQMKSVLLQRYNPSANEWEIMQYTCPYCGHVETAIDTHGHAISTAAKSTLESTYTNAEVTE
ncbi:hypothetical protein KAR91_16090 [Candidatus Pacearchaeota archaeon]|nr:hypothetical protein [Candidatus Pacearchaeota archaeon]